MPTIVPEYRDCPTCACVTHQGVCKDAAWHCSTCAQYRCGSCDEYRAKATWVRFTWSDGSTMAVEDSDLARLFAEYGLPTSVQVR